MDNMHRWHSSHLGIWADGIGLTGIDKIGESTNIACRNSNGGSRVGYRGGCCASTVTMIGESL